jgi:hypothetical protein
MFILTNGRRTGQQVFWNGSGTGEYRDFRSHFDDIRNDSLWRNISNLRPDRASEVWATAVPSTQNGSMTRHGGLFDAPCSLSRSFRGVPLLLLELRFIRRRRRPRRTLPSVFLSLGHLGPLLSGQHVRDLRHHFRVSDFHFHLNLRSRFSR